MQTSLLPNDDDALPSLRNVDLPRVGDVVDDTYVIAKLIGEGGMGVVYGAVHRRLGLDVAIKFLHPQALASRSALARFELEARAAGKLRGAHVARVLDVGACPGGVPYIVMELLHGRDLEVELQVRGALGVAEAVDILLEACDAMREAHACGIVHRDLKPSNIFLAEGDGNSLVVKVLDFGVSLLTLSPAPRVTSTQMTLGTPLYMSPEQVRCSKRVDARTDVWSLGVVLYEALVGAPPFAGSSTAAVAAIVADRTPSARAQRREIPASLDAVIARALSKDVESRFQSVEAFARSLAPFGSGRGRRGRARDEAARTWLAPVSYRVQETVARASVAAFAVRAAARSVGLRRLCVVAGIGTCLLVVPAITFAGFERRGDEARAPCVCYRDVDQAHAAARRDAIGRAPALSMTGGGARSPQTSR